MDLFKAGKVDALTFKFLEPLLKQQTLAVIQNFKADLKAAKIDIPDDVIQAFGAILNAKLKEALRKRKTNAMHLFLSL